LLDTTTDVAYLNTDECALAKARQERLLRMSGNSNYTIVRPYITYSDERLQLGIFEKEMWLYRTLRGRSIIFGKDEASHLTTMTFGGDVAACIADLILNKSAYGKIINITQDKPISWGEVLNLYCEVIHEDMGYKPNITWCQDMRSVADKLGKHYQYTYDRLYDRQFDTSGVETLYPPMRDALPPQEGLKKSLKELIHHKHSWRRINWRFEGLAHRLSGEFTPLSEIPGIKNKLKYLMTRFGAT
jgi:hypothetical protein